MPLDFETILSSNSRDSLCLSMTLIFVQARICFPLRFIRGGCAHSRKPEAADAFGAR